MNDIIKYLDDLKYTYGAEHVGLNIVKGNKIINVSICDTEEDKDGKEDE